MTRQSLFSLIRAFLKDTSGNYALMTVIAAVPLFGAVALAVDYSEMSRERQMTLNALDASGIATARRLLEGASELEVRKYARQFFDANLGNINPNRATLKVDLPGQGGGGTLKMSADLSYDPVFFGTFQSLMGKQRTPLSFAAATEVKLKNTIEVALVLDNSGSMGDRGRGSGRQRLDILKDAAKELVDTMAAESGKMKQVDKPVQIGLVPFSASVNVGPDNRYESWMDRNGLSPIHHENFDWSSFGTRASSPNMYVEDVNGAKRARGRYWAEVGLENAYLTRFTLFDYVRRYTGQGNTTAPVATWGGCVETRPYPYNVTDAAASQNNPATLFVPMFAPDEADIGRAANSWWPDYAPDDRSAPDRQRDLTKFINVSHGNGFSAGSGPNYGCTTTPILPLKDVGTTAGIDEVKSAIDAMRANGNTNTPEGMAWGWRVLSSQAPFTGGRSEAERGNDKVLIVLTDGANTYFTPSGDDLARNRSTYGSYGYAGKNYSNTGKPRIFLNTTVSTSFSNSNYTKALNQQFDTLCANAKRANIIVMTVALDLDARSGAEKAQVDALKACSSESRFRKDAQGNPEKLFWNSTGATLADDFKRIADELSNLRIVS
ncbi:hypothetical protein JYU29_02175 [Tianweitania sp. BSSL-BM11]|uniref:VWFA domain-containing protein n=2 Tax=Tianweitania aestuarii TaxID=2814886 RepID=A0ABS5RTC9_9HYPH|nr:hypothetical protein [Tianweitania aestuarii]